LNDILAHEGLKEESFIFLADMANMPYGSYALENNVELLIEHIFKDIQFLMGNKYYQHAGSKRYSKDKDPVKAVVIACNTATAYGLDTIRSFFEEAGLDLGVIGVIDAGSQGAFGNFSFDENGSIAVIATDGTVKSGAYPESITYVKNRNGQLGIVQVFQQAGIGIAESIDENIEFIDRNADTPRNGYKGPSDTGCGDMKIDLAIWDRYNFNMADSAILFDGDPVNPYNLQINSVENYISFHLVSLMEKIRKTENSQPLNSVVLACTHYPFFEETFRQTIDRLRDYKENGEYVYRKLIAEDFIIVNPASVVAVQLYDHLDSGGLLNRSDSQAGSEFYVSVPNVLNKKNILRDDGLFTYEYKYGRRQGDVQEYVKCVPFSRTYIPEEILRRLSEQVPGVFDLIIRFNRENPKTDYLDPAEKI